MTNYREFYKEHTADAIIAELERLALSLSEEQTKRERFQAFMEGEVVKASDLADRLAVQLRKAEAERDESDALREKLSGSNPEAATPLREYAGQCSTLLLRVRQDINGCGEVLSATMDQIDAHLAALSKNTIESGDEEVRSLAAGGAQLTQGGGDAAGMPLSVGRSRPDQTATYPSTSPPVSAETSALATPNTLAGGGTIYESVGFQYRFPSPWGGYTWRDSDTRYNGHDCHGAREIFVIVKEGKAVNGVGNADRVAETLAVAVANVKPVVERERAAEQPSAGTMSMVLRAGSVIRMASSLDAADDPRHRLVEVGFNRRPTDDELTALFDYVQAFPSQVNAERIWTVGPVYQRCAVCGKHKMEHASRPEPYYCPTEESVEGNAE